MSYGLSKYPAASVVASTSALTLGSTGFTAQAKIGSNILIRRIQCYISTAVVSTATVVVIFYDRPTGGSSSSQVAIGTLNIVTGQAADTVVYKDVSYVMAPGHELSVNVSVATAGGSAAGAGFMQIEAEDAPEAAANLAKLTASS